MRARSGPQRRGSVCREQTGRIGRGCSLEGADLAVFGHVHLLVQAKPVQTLLHARTGDGGMGYVVHVAYDNFGLRAGLSHHGHVLIVHDEAVKAHQFGRAGIEDNDIGGKALQGVGHALVPDGVAGHIERFFFGVAEEDTAGGAAGHYRAVAAWRPGEGNAGKGRARAQDIHPGKARTGQDFGIFAALHKAGHILGQISAHGAVLSHVYVIGVHMGDDAGIDALQHLFSRHGQIVDGHGNGFLFGVADLKGRVGKAAHAALAGKPGIDEKGCPGKGDAQGGIADLFYAHGKLLEKNGVQECVPSSFVQGADVASASPSGQSLSQEILHPHLILPRADRKDRHLEFPERSIFLPCFRLSPSTDWPCNQLYFLWHRLCLCAIA